MSRSMPAVRAHQLGGLRDDSEVGQPEEVDLQQTDLRHAVHVELRDRGAVTGVERCSGTILASGSEPITTPAACVEALRQIPSSRRALSMTWLRPILVLVQLAELAALLKRALERDAHHLRHQLRKPVDVRERHVEHAPDVADGRPGRHRPEGDDLRDPVATILLLHVREHAIAPDDRRSRCRCPASARARG